MNRLERSQILRIAQVDYHLQEPGEVRIRALGRFGETLEAGPGLGGKSAARFRVLEPRDAQACGKCAADETAARIEAD